MEENKLYQSPIKKVGEEDDIPTIIHPIFLGGSMEMHRVLNECAIAFLSFDSAKKKNKEAEAKIFWNKFEELREEHFPELTSRDLSNYVTVYFQFIQRYMDRAIVRAEGVTDNDDLINRIRAFEKNLPEGDFKPVPFINPVNPKVRATQTMSERMRRRYNAGTQDNPDLFTVHLHNSFILVKIHRPVKSDYIRLINDIENELRYFGSRWSINSLSLERAGISKKIVDFFIDKIAQHSVEGILAPSELKQLILSNDINTIALALLQAGSTRGVHYNLNCLVNKCRHSELIRIDPYDLDLVNEADMEDDQKNFINDVFNGGMKKKPSEIIAMQNRYRYKGVPVDQAVKIYDNPVVTENTPSIGEFKISVPTLVEYFNTFDMMAETYDPTIKKYAIDYPAVDEFRKKRAEFMGSIRMGEYLHWISEFTTYGDKLKEQEDETDRRVDDQREFEKGLLSIFGNDDYMYWNVLAKITSVVPFMSHNFIGIKNSECPGCHGKVTDNKDDPEGFTTITGFTPIDIVTNFFDHTRMLIEEMGSQYQVQEETIS